MLFLADEHVKHTNFYKGVLSVVCAHWIEK